MAEDNSNAVHSSRNYDEFKIIEANRLLDKNHIQQLIKSFSDSPDLSRTHPILVNENLEIIDGQHRYMAWKEMGTPIYYLQEKGLTVEDAIRLNANQRAWKIGDYARAYAMTGNTQYQQFLELREEFKFPYRVIQLFCEGYQAANAVQRFKTGNLKLMKDKTIIRQRLEMLQDIADMWPKPMFRGLALALFEAFKNPDYNHDLFVGKFKLRGEHELSTFNGTKNDWLRALENIYNYYTPQEEQIRLF